MEEKIIVTTLTRHILGQREPEKADFETEESGLEPQKADQSMKGPD